MTEYNKKVRKYKINIEKYADENSMKQEITNQRQLKTAYFCQLECTRRHLIQSSVMHLHHAPYESAAPSPLGQPLLKPKRKLRPVDS